jgi:hypothetical protein
MGDDRMSNSLVDECKRLKELMAIRRDVCSSECPSWLKSQCGRWDKSEPESSGWSLCEHVTAAAREKVEWGEEERSMTEKGLVEQCIWLCAKANVGEYDFCRSDCPDYLKSQCDRWKWLAIPDNYGQHNKQGQELCSQVAWAQTTASNPVAKAKRTIDSLTASVREMDGQIASIKQEIDALFNRLMVAEDTKKALLARMNDAEGETKSICR